MMPKVLALFLHHQKTYGLQFLSRKKAPLWQGGNLFDWKLLGTLCDTYLTIKTEDTGAKYNTSRFHEISTHRPSPIYLRAGR
jgi:hypothetical protein